MGREWAAVAGALVVLGLVFFGDALWFGLTPVAFDVLMAREPWRSSFPEIVARNPLLSDPVLHLHPWYEFAAEAVRDGRVPLWNPANGAGAPFLANNLSSLFFPLHWLFWFMPVAQAYLPIFIAKIVLAGLGTFGFLRSLDLAPGPAFFGSVNFAFGGFMILWLAFPHSSVLLFLPWLFWSTERLLVVGTARATAILALAIGGQHLAGCLEVSLIVLYACGFYFLYRLAGSLCMGKSYDWVGQRVAWFTLAVLVGSLLGAIQILPSMEYYAHSYRRVFTQSAIGFFAAENWSLERLRDAWCLLWPDYYGNPMHGTYAGPRNYNIVNSPHVGAVALVLAAASLARLRSDRRVRLFAVLAAVSAACVYSFPVVYALVKALPLMRTAGDGYIAGLLGFALCMLAAFELDARLREWSARAPKGRSAEVGVAAVGTAVVTTLVVLFAFGRNFNPPTGLDRVYPETPVTRFLASQPGHPRVAGANGALLFSSHMPYGLADPFATDVLDPLDFTLFANLAVFDGRNVRSLAEIPLRESLWSHPVLDFLGVGFVVSAAPLAVRGFERVEGLVPHVYRNTEAMPRAFFTSQVQIEPDLRVIHEAFARPDFDPRATLFLDQMPATRPNPEAAGRVRVVAHEPELVALEVESSGPGVVVLTDVHFPGWTAYVDGEERTILRANHAFRAVPLEAGKHTVRFEYRPWSFSVGVGLSLCGAIAMTLLACGASPRSLVSGAEGRPGHRSLRRG